MLVVMMQTDVDNGQPMFVLTILENIKKGGYEEANYEEARVKLTSTQLNKLISAAKSSAGTTLRIIKKNFQDEKI